MPLHTSISLEQQQQHHNHHKKRKPDFTGQRNAPYTPTNDKISMKLSLLSLFCLVAKTLGQYQFGDEVRRARVQFAVAFF
jgi:hypothetical protein